MSLDKRQKRIGPNLLWKTQLFHESMNQRTSRIPFKFVVKTDNGKHAPKHRSSYLSCLKLPFLFLRVFQSAQLCKSNLATGNFCACIILSTSCKIRSNRIKPDPIIVHQLTRSTDRALTLLGLVVLRAWILLKLPSPKLNIKKLKTPGQFWTI